ncbi:MAG: substrate-binding domain-containing protein [Rivularia sp. (in: Bacteria)]|nr:substrate-binding domain-containing protein [Rivularia sp. MS3]
MNNTTKKLIPLSRDSIQLVKGLIIGKVLTILVMGGLWLLVRQYLQPGSSISASEGVDPVSETAASTFKTVRNVPIGSFQYSGSNAWAPIRQLVNSLIQSDRPELKLEYSHPQTDTPISQAAIEMLLDGQIDFAQLSRPLTESEYAASEQKGFTLKQRQVATDGVAVAVNPALSISGLTVEQLQQIYLGKITNWKELGGPDLAITPFSENIKDVKSTLFDGKQLDEQELAANVEYVYSPTAALRKVNQNKGGVYFGSARAIVPQCSVKTLKLGTTSDNLVAPYIGKLVEANQCPQKRNRVNTKAIKNGSYPLKSKLFVVTKENNATEEQVGNAYTKLLLTSEGQKAISEAGFVPVR